MTTPTRLSIGKAGLAALRDQFKRMKLDSFQVAQLVQELHDCMQCDAYTGYGSVELDLVSSTMKDEISTFMERTICTDCNGSGEGQHDCTTCSACRGNGELPSPEEFSKTALLEPA